MNILSSSPRKQSNNSKERDKAIELDANGNLKQGEEDNNSDKIVEMDVEDTSLTVNPNNFFNELDCYYYYDEDDLTSTLILENAFSYSAPSSQHANGLFELSLNGLASQMTSETDEWNWKTLLVDSNSIALNPNDLNSSGNNKEGILFKLNNDSNGSDCDGRLVSEKKTTTTCKRNKTNIEVS